MLQDGYGRALTYLRVSLLKGCNLTCRYCMPERIPFRMDEVLDADEIERLVGRFVERGIRKVRLTGGEPTLRPDLVEIVERLAALDGLHDLSLSTNAVRLARLARPLKEAGLRRINVSLDSLRPSVFERITGYDVLAQVIAGLDAAAEVGFHPIKLNTVVLRGINDDEVRDLVDFAAARGMALRFIEMMPTGANHAAQGEQFVSNQEVLERLGGNLVWEAVGAAQGSGPARYYRNRKHPEHPEVGFINPLSQIFCADCNRLRLTADGRLRTCLFGREEVPLRQALQAPDWREQLDPVIDAALQRKPLQHELAKGDWGTTVSFVQIGG